MSYEFIIVLPTVAFGVICALVSLSGRTRGRVLLGVIAVATSVLPSWWGDARVGCSLGLGPDQWRCAQLKAQRAGTTGVDARILQADIVEDAAAGARAYLPWSLVPLLLGALASARARSPWAVWGVIGAAAVLALPLVVALVRPAVEQVVPVDDPRWAVERARQALELEGGAPMQTLESSCFALRGVAAAGGVEVPPQVRDGCSLEAVFGAIEDRVKRSGGAGDGCLAFERLRRPGDREALRAKLESRFSELERVCGLR